MVDGSIKIKKANIEKNEYIMNIISNTGDKITSNEINIYISHFLSYKLITEKEAKLLKVATSDNVLNIPQMMKDSLRANIFKNMLLNLIED